MSFIKMDVVDTGHPVVRKPIIFGSAVDLAHVYNKEWAINNLVLANSTDQALAFIYQEILAKKLKRNFIDKFMFKRNIHKSRTSLNLFIRELRGLVCEVEALIGFNTYLREGKKSKIKHKKIFDDHITERREIVIMLQGLLLFLETNQASEIDFSNEIHIMEEIQKTAGKTKGYFMTTCVFLNAFEF